MTNPTALVIDDEPSICELLAITLKRMSIHTISAQSISEAKLLLKKHSFDLCLTDMRLPDGDGLDLVAFVQEYHPDLPIAVITAHGNMETAIKALKNGAFDFISKPVDLPILRDIVSSALKLNQSKNNHHPDPLVGTADVMQHLRHNITKLARSQAPIYISGPSGSGKELVARMIHQSGPRFDQPFIPVNCGAIPQELMESEFFGYRKGSFTGATQDKIGFFQAAHKGILFLDEVADLPLSMQVKLLRAIQEKAIRPIGSNNEVSIDVRILCATHKDLSDLVHHNLFRQDLFYRLNVIEIKVPSLKERLSDLPLLINHILEKIAKINEVSLPILDESALSALSQYHFPGNIRELENLLERAYILSDGHKIMLKDLQLNSRKDQALEDKNEEPKESLMGSLDDYLYKIERQTILDAIAKNQGNKANAAKQLGISLRTLRYRLKKLHLDAS